MPEVTPSRYLINAGWDDVPHLDEKTKSELLAETPPHLRAARSKGIASVGAGAIYPIPFEDVSCAPFAIPDFWRRGYGFDVGWKNTAALWLAEDPTSDTLYAYSEYMRGEQLPIVHAAAIKARGAWVKGAIDPASRTSGQEEGKKLLNTYRSDACGLIVKTANNAVEAGLQRVWERLETGRLKFFSTLVKTEGEYRLYRRQKKVTDFGEKVSVVKKKDHLMDCLRYGVVEFDSIAGVRPAAVNETLNGAFRAVDKKIGY